MPKFPDMSESEARALLARPLRCEDCGTWRQERSHPSKLKVRAGLVDSSGARTDLFVELAISQIALGPPGARPVIRHYIFSVYWRNLGKVNRVYQLDVQQSSKRATGAHCLPHDHLGDRRRYGDPAWINWSFGKILKYFCWRTNVRFDPWPDEPASTEFKGKRR